MKKNRKVKAEAIVHILNHIRFVFEMENIAGLGINSEFRNTG